MTTTCLIVFLFAALLLTLHDRRIYPRQGTWWAVTSIALAVFITGMLL